MDGDHRAGSGVCTGREGRTLSRRRSARLWAIVAQLPDGRFPIIRQYRPALESFTWELPAGLLDEGEDPAACCRRELMEETGFTALSLHPLGRYAPCSGRFSNWLHSFFVTIGPARRSW